MKQRLQKTIEMISETKSWFFQNINKIGKTLVTHIKKKDKEIEIKNKNQQNMKGKKES